MANPESQVTEVGSFEAKTRLAELLREAENGREFVILRRGKPVAKLVPIEGGDSCKDNLASRFQAVRDSIDGTFDIREMLEEGRR